MPSIQFHEITNFESTKEANFWLRHLITCSIKASSDYNIVYNQIKMVW